MSRAFEYHSTESI